jgi:putative DNA methylase
VAVVEAREKALTDASAAGLASDAQRLHENGAGAAAYADVVATYLALLIGKLADKGSTLCTWDAGPTSSRTASGRSARVATVRVTFFRQALSMTWDFAEANFFSDSVGSVDAVLRTLTAPLEYSAMIPEGRKVSIRNFDASNNPLPIRPTIISSDPLYYDNIGFADLSDFSMFGSKIRLLVSGPTCSGD